MSPQQGPAPARAGWNGGVGLDWSVHMPGSLLLGSGHGSWGALCGAACLFCPFACGVPILEAPTAEREGSLASARGHPCLSHLQEPGIMDQDPSAQGTLWGVPSLWGPVCCPTMGATPASPWP